MLTNEIMLVLITITTFITFKYIRIIWIPLPIVLAAYFWYKLEPVYWYIKLRYYDATKSIKILHHRRT